MAAQVPDNWNKVELYIGPYRPFRRGHQSPYNLFSLKGERSTELRRAWYGTPGNQWGTVQQTRWIHWHSLLALMLLLGSGLLLSYYQHEAWAVTVEEQYPAFFWLIWPATIALACAVFYERPGQDDELEEIKHSGVVTVEIRASSAGFWGNRAKPTVLHRHRSHPLLEP